MLCYYCSSLDLYPDIQAMPLTEELDKDEEHSELNADAGCTPKLSRRKLVANNCGQHVVELSAIRTPGSCHICSSSSWLCAIKKSTKYAVDNRKKVCCSPLQLPGNKMAESIEKSGNIIPDMTCNNNIKATSLHDENKRTLSPQHLKVC